MKSLADYAYDELTKKKLSLAEYNEVLDIIQDLCQYKTSRTIMKNVYDFFNSHSAFGYSTYPEGIGWVVYKTNDKSNIKESNRRKRFTEGRQVTDVVFPWAYMSDTRNLSKAEIRKRLDNLEDALADISDGFRKFLTALSALEDSQLDVFNESASDCPINSDWGEFSMDWDAWANEYYNALESDFKRIK